MRARGPEPLAGPRLSLDGGALCVAWDGRVVGTLRVALAREGAGRVPAQDWRAVGSEPDAWVTPAGDLTVECRAAEFPGGTVLAWRVVNAGVTPAVLRRFRAAFSPAPELWPASPEGLCGLKIAYCGAHSRSPHSRSGVVALADVGTVRSWWVGAIAPRRGGPGLVVGALDFRTFATAVDLERGGATAVQFLEGWRLAPGEGVEPASIGMGLDRGAPLAPLEAYATEVGRRHGTRACAPPCGWGSWGHYLEAIDADLMRENLLALQGSRRLRDVVTVVQIDDGWSEMLETQRVSSSWRPNRRFPSGIAPLADEVRRAARDCGLWILPFTVNEGSPLADAHPDYLVKDAAGAAKRVGGGGSFCLDPTHPGARAWLFDLLSRVRDWGVTYVKLDFLRGLLMPDPDLADDDFDVPRVYHAARTRVEAYRRGLELVRAALGPEAFLVGCSAPGGPGAGLVDAHRVGPDVEPEWSGATSGIRDAVRALAANYFWQGRAWVNDPDYLLAGASLEESRFWATAVALSGGSAIISADLSELAPWQEELFAAVTPPIGRAARPLDLFASAPDPRLWLLELSRGDVEWRLVGLFNWSDAPAELTVDLGALGFSGDVHLWDVWRRQHRVARGREACFVEPRSAALFGARAALGRPQLVGTDAHFSQGAWELDGEVWDPDRRVLCLRASDGLARAGFVYVWVPERFRCTDGGEPWAERDDVVRAALARGRAIELAFEESLSR